jgi:hypothetical protein
MQPSTTKGSVEHCDTCGRRTPHQTAQGGWPVCGYCGAIKRPKGK